MFCTFRSNADPEYGRDFDLKPETEEEKERFVLRLCSSCEEEGKVQQALAKCKVDPQTFSFSIIQCCSVIKFYISFTVGPIQLNVSRFKPALNLNRVLKDFGGFKPRLKFIK